MDGDARLRVTLLGAFQASRGGVALPVPGARSRGLLVRLALAGGRAVERGVLVDAIWAEDPPAGPAHALQARVSRLRRTLGSAGDVAQVAGGYRLAVDAADVDALRFEQLAAAGRDRLRAGDPNAAAAVLGEAVALWGDRSGTEPTVVAAVAPGAATRLAHASVEAVADLARIDTLFAAGRLVTVLGPGGAGKTRLAVEAARRHRHEYRDGAWMIDLASVTEPAKVGAAVLAGIGLRSGAMFEARMRVEGAELDVLVDQLGGRESLLLVDNCEHLIDAVAHLVTALLTRCSGLRVLATSREPLAVDGEALVPLGPLALPGPDDGVEQARQAASVRLFTERAAAVRPGFDVDETTLPEVRRVVRGLDGMPLALELAAARLRTLSLPELADGLSDRFRLLTTGSRTVLPRHRTLRAVIAWSWELLSEHERTVAERVSILPGGVTPASATAICAGAAVPAAEIPELLASLVDRSLLQLAPDPGRYVTTRGRWSAAYGPRSAWRRVTWPARRRRWRRRTRRR
ncbi:BTAD domain-containing putative transcriptional regulator [Actinoallomurus sp. NPDC050550]|uniref:ATP-binding protein n=1 Tax=Actinoallomurus sp. NPDC050550 TaxID=3154937 RepID=UPI0033EDCA1C